jgi:hypothetical protein
MKYNKKLLRVLKVQKSVNTPNGYSNQDHFHALSLVDCINLLAFSKSAWALKQINKASERIAKYLKRIMQSAKLIIIITTISIPSAQAKDFGARGHAYKIIEQGFLEMIGRLGEERK